MKYYALLLTLFLSMGNTVFAAWDVDRDDLDDDIVDEIYMPVLFGVSLSDIVSDYGEPRGGGSREHEGQDMFAPEGTPIVSPTEAIVIRTGEGLSAGKYVYTANPGGETFRYMHLDYVANLETGDELDPGDFIGTVGDTGNAPDGVYHLHFEIRDEDNDPLDPFDRLKKEFSTKSQVSFLKDIFRDIKNDSTYAKFLINTYPDIFKVALREEYDLPRAVEDALEDSDIEDAQEAEQDLEALLGAIPAALTNELDEGDSSVLVALLQLYLVYTTDGEARDQLALAGPTGYYGAITKNAILSYQEQKNIPETGIYDSKTRWEMMDHPVILNLD